jgi:hypothetical protein
MEFKCESKLLWYKKVFLDLSLVTIVLAVVVMAKANIDHVEARITEMSQEKLIAEQRAEYWEGYWKAREKSTEYVEDKHKSIK